MDFDGLPRIQWELYLYESDYPMDISAYFSPLEPMDFHGLIFMDAHGFSWILMASHGFIWILNDYGFLWILI